MSYYQNTLLMMPNTLGIIAQCWKAAELDLQNEIKRYYPSSDEEFITRLFHGRFAAALEEVSRAGIIATNFLADLQATFPDLSNSTELYRIANGLVADVTLHKRKTEAFTGGDFGFMVIRPQVTDHGEYLAVQDYRRGILGQAKLKDEKDKWGRFTRKQKQVLPHRLGYLGLLLYSYEDDDRRILQPFHWNLCHAMNMQELESCLKKDSFPELFETDTIIQAVGNGYIGTDNKQILDEIVSPVGNPSLIITIWWPSGNYPGSQVYVYSRETIRQHERTVTQVRLQA